ncbi:very long chain fatty acid elongase 7-like isoform X1 [Artemia franciscana]
MYFVNNDIERNNFRLFTNVLPFVVFLASRFCQICRKSRIFCKTRDIHVQSKMDYTLDHEDDWLNITHNESRPSYDEFDEDWQRYKGSALVPLHPLVQDWPLVGNYHYNIMLVIGYLAIVKYFGPKFMQDRKPFELRGILQLYNICQILFSSYLFWALLSNGLLSGYSLKCEPMDYSVRGLPIARASWLYYISKHTEFFDTFFFVLRKKTNQITLLHLVHHAGMPIIVGFGMRTTPGGQGTFFGVLNSLVHVVMYTYYFLAALGPSVQKYLWWKSYITQMQLIQFVIVFFHAAQVFIYKDCDFPKVIAGVLCSFSFLMLIMFSQFYITMYLRNRSAKANKLK